MGRLVRLIGSGVGLASEAIYSHKSSAASVSGNPPVASGQAVPPHSNEENKEAQHDDDDDATSEEGDEEQWELDDGGIVALAIGFAQIYLHEQIHQGHLYGLPDLALLYVSKFREAYCEEV